MSDEKGSPIEKVGLRLLQFKQKIAKAEANSTPEPKVPASTGTATPRKWGVYPLGKEDVVVSVNVLAVIILLLREGSPEDRKIVADSLDNVYRMYYL